MVLQVLSATPTVSIPTPLSAQHCGQDECVVGTMCPEHMAEVQTTVTKDRRTKFTHCMVSGLRGPPCVYCQTTNKQSSYLVSMLTSSAAGYANEPQGGGANDNDCTLQGLTGDCATGLRRNHPARDPGDDHTVSAGCSMAEGADARTCCLYVKH